MPPTRAALVPSPAATLRGPVMPADSVEPRAARAVRANFAVRSEALFQSLLVKQVDIRTPELHVRTLALHRHFTENPVIDAHQHRWCQALLYLSGWGQQMFSNECADVEPGVLVMLPPGQPHSFYPSPNRPALCLVLDFQLKRAVMPARKVCTISRGDLTQTREQIGYLLRMQAKGGDRLGWESTAVVLQLVIRFLRAAGWLERVPPAALSDGDSAMHRLLLTMDLESPLRQVVSRSGYQRDHLNRLVKKETGLTLGQFRAQRRLAKAKEMLARGIKVGDVAEGIGLPDPSYFARWFRRQTGQSPTRWLRQGTDHAVADVVPGTGPAAWSDDDARRVCFAG